MSAYNRRREKQYSLWGWLLFVVCADFFIASAVISGDVLYLIGSIVFFDCLPSIPVSLDKKGRSRERRIGCLFNTTGKRGFVGNCCSERVPGYTPTIILTQVVLL